jgi:hypothetical protein
MPTFSFIASPKPTGDKRERRFTGLTGQEEKAK